MKKIILILVGLLNISLSSAKDLKLPMACEDLAWKYATVQTAAEAYADIVDIRFDQARNEYSALVRTNETEWFQMNFRYTQGALHECLILKLVTSYR